MMRGFPAPRGQRRTPGQMNKLEAAYAALLEGQKAAGLVVWYAYEGVKLKLAPATFFTPDFCVMLSGGEIELHEVKGWMEDDAAVKLKVAATLFPFPLKLVTRGRGGQWETRDV